MALYANAKASGICVNCGYTMTNIVPIYNGHVLKHCVNILELGGKHITNYLMKLLRHNDDSCGVNTVCNIKEQLCYVSQNYQQQIANIKTTKYQLPDGKHIDMQTEMIESIEILFNPLDFGIENSKGIDEMLCDSVLKCEMELNAKNVILNGGLRNVERN